MIDKKKKIYESGKRVFSSRGFRDTSVSDIMKVAEMATGTFYNYYSSKDKLFMDIYLEENKKLKQSIMKSVNINAEPMKVIKDIIDLNFKGMSSNPILKEWYNKDVFSKIEHNFRKENGLENVNFLYDSFIEIIKKWQTEGKMRIDIDAEMIMVIFVSVINVDTHKAEIGLQYFPDVINYLFEFTMKGLMNCSNKE